MSKTIGASGIRRKIALALAVPAAALSVGVVAPAMAAAPPHITGSFSLTSPTQYETINNVSPAGGSLSYTNFNYPDPGSGVWTLNSPITLNYSLGGATYSHTLIVDTIQPTGLNAFTFTGHGSYNADPSYTWTASGTVTGTSFALHILYTGSNAGYTADTAATINPDGSMSGTASDSASQSLTFTAPASSAFEVLSYTAPVSGVQISGNTGTFSSAIPSGHALAGTGFTIKVTDGGSPGAGHDTYLQDGTPYVITSGNLVVH